MNCRDWEERIALYAGGDLPAAAAAEVERHLAECAGCQVFASGLGQSLEWLKRAHAEEIPAAHYTALRARVLSAVERDRRRWWAWAAAAAAVAVLAAVAGAGLRMRVADLPMAAAKGAAPPAGWEARAAEERASLPRLGRPGGIAHKAARTEQVVVKIETDNPDVVIYWIAETKGEN